MASRIGSSIGVAKSATKARFRRTDKIPNELFPEARE